MRMIRCLEIIYTQFGRRPEIQRLRKDPTHLWRSHDNNARSRWTMFEQRGFHVQYICINIFCSIFIDTYVFSILCMQSLCWIRYLTTCFSKRLRDEVSPKYPNNDKQRLFNTAICWSGGCEQSSILASSHSTMSADHGAGAATGMGHHYANPNSNCLKFPTSESDASRGLKKKVNDPVGCVHVGCGYYDIYIYIHI